MAEARAELDGAMIGAAATRAVTLWPEEPESEPGDGYAWRSQVVTKGEPDAPGAGAEPDRAGATGGVPSPRTGFSKGSRESQQRSGKGGSTPAEP